MTIPQSRRSGILFWDLAGTLVARSRITGGLVTMAGVADVLARLRSHYSLCVTTGEGEAGARAYLRQADLIDHFDEIHTGLWAPSGKPYGEILAGLQVEPERCLVIGDRPVGDLPADTDRLVTLLVNQDGFTTHAEAVEALIAMLAGEQGNFLRGFDALQEEATRVQQSDPPAWRLDGDLPCKLIRQPHPLLPGEQRVVILPG